MLAHRREDLHALDRVDAKVGFEIHRELEHIDGVARLLSDHFKHQRLKLRCAAGRVRNWSGGIRHGPALRKVAAHPVDNLLQRAQLAKFRGIHLGQIHRSFGSLLTHGREDLDALDRVDAKVRFEVHRELEHIDGVAGLLGDHFKHQALKGFGAAATRHTLCDGRDSGR